MPRYINCYKCNQNGETTTVCTCGDAMDNYIVELQEGCWIAPWDGDPGRTLVRDSAKIYQKKWIAEKALDKARSIPGRNFISGKVIRVHA